MSHILALLGPTGMLLTQSYGDDEGGAWLLLLLGPGAGVLFYILMFLRYRNTDKRHAYERETDSQMVDLRVHDQLVRRQTGLRNSRIQGGNNTSPRTRLGQGTRVTTMDAAPQTPPVQAPPAQHPQAPAPPVQNLPPQAPPAQNFPPQQPGV